MAENYRLTRPNITAVISSGNGSARLDATIAEQKAEEALKKAEEALAMTNDLDKAAQLVNTLNDKLDAEITRSKAQDEVHAEKIQTLSNQNFEISFEDIDPDELWPENNEEEN